MAVQRVGENEPAGTGYMNKKKLNVYSLDQIKDEMIGKEGTPARDQYEFEIKLDLLGEMIKTARQERNLTQAQLDGW